MHAIAKLAAAGTIAATLALNPTAAVPAPADAAMLGKDVLKGVILGDLRSQLSGALDEMGCRGTALAGVTGTASPGRTAAGGTPPVGVGGSAAGTPGGLPRPAGVPYAGGNIMPKAAGSAESIAAARAAQPASARAGGANIDPAMLAMMMALMQPQADGVSPGSADQASGMKDAIAAIEQAIARPLSRAETAAVFRELADLGIITPAMASEARDCVMQASPAAVEAAGIAASILTNVLIPRLAAAKTRLSNLSPEEQNAVVEAMIEELRNAPAADRSVFFDGYGRGFYPKTIVDRVRSRL